MYYLFLRRKNELERYKAELERVMKAIEGGKTPVFNEIRNARTGFIESIPFNVVNGAFIIAGSFLIDSIKVNEVVKIAVVMIVNSFCYQVANYLFVNTKHRLRIRLCRRLGIEPTERTIAAMESLEYQSV